MADHGPRVINLNFNRPSAAQIAAIVIGALLIVLLIAVLLTSSYTVGAESEGVALRFGEFFKTVEPGLHFKLPLGIDAVTVLPIRRQLKLDSSASPRRATRIRFRPARIRSRKNPWSPVT